MTVVNGLFDDAAVILRHKALWAIQKAKQKQRWRRLDIEESDLKLGLFHILADTSKDRRVAVGADGGRKDQPVDKVFHASLLDLEVLLNENQLIDNIAQRRKERLT